MNRFIENFEKIKSFIRIKLKLNKIFLSYWRKDIEKAPKDGRNILVRVASGEVMSAKYVLYSNSKTNGYWYYRLIGVKIVEWMMMPE